MLMFSATWSEDVEAVSKKIWNLEGRNNQEKVKIVVGNTLAACRNVTQTFREVGQGDKLEFLRKVAMDVQALLAKHERAIIFVDDKETVSIVVEFLRRLGFSVEGYAQEQCGRDQVLRKNQDPAGELQWIVATRSCRALWTSQPPSKGEDRSIRTSQQPTNHMFANPHKLRKQLPVVETLAA